MAQARQILDRISSVSNTQKITRAMKMVAAAKLNRAQSRMESVRPYASGISRIFSGIASDLYGDEHPLLITRNPEKVLTIVIAGDRGLCGGFNNNVLRMAKSHLEGLNNVENKLFAVGKRAISGARKLGVPVVKSWFDVFDKLSFMLSSDIAEQLLTMYQAKDENRIDEVYLVFNKFVSRMSQEVVVEKLMPLDLVAIKQRETTDDKSQDDAYIRPVYEIEPSPAEALSSLIKHFISCEIYHAIIESYSAELAARMTSMENATSSAEDMIDSLTLEYNRARQAGITAELLDIIGGANAL